MLRAAVALLIVILLGMAFHADGAFYKIGRIAMRCGRHRCTGFWRAG